MIGGVSREEILRRFESWLDAALTAEEPPAGLDAGFLAALAADGGAAGEPGCDTYSLWSAMTTLAQEVKLQGRAFKELNDTLGEQPGRIADQVRASAFDRERELLTRIKHPAVVDLYDWGHGEDFRYIVTEYFPSGSLELRIRNLMTVRDSVDIFVQIAGALVAVHAAQLCHRDLKPANVMMRPDGRIVLIDFGLAKSMANGAELTNAGEIRGSPYYISPEQAEGSDVDQRSDLYSLGVMFCEMLTGKRPFRGSSVVTILQSHRNDPIPVLPPELAQFQRLIDGLLAKEPQNRFPTAAAALGELARMKV